MSIERATIGMSIEDAAALIRREWDKLCSMPDDSKESRERNSRGFGPLHATKATALSTDFALDGVGGWMA